MIINVKVEHGGLSLPPDLCPPDGTIVQIVLPQQAIVKKTSKLSRLHTFKGDGLRPGIDLSDPSTVWAVLESDGEYSNLPL